MRRFAGRQSDASQCGAIHIHLPTGCKADVVATAKCGLQAGGLLEGECGYTVWGKLRPADTSRKQGNLALGLAHNIKLLRPVRQGRSLCWEDVAIDTSTRAYPLRPERGTF